MLFQAALRHVAASGVWMLSAAPPEMYAATPTQRAAPLRVADAPDVSGVYVGEYECTKSTVRLKLKLTSRSEGAITAVFTLYPKEMPAGSKGDSFAFSLVGRYSPTGDTQLRPQRWHSPRPPSGSGYVVLGMNGRFNLSAGTFRGNISGGGCGAFNVTRDAALSAEAAGPRERAPRSTATSASTAPAPPSPEPRGSGQAGSASVPSTSATSPKRVVPQESAASKEARTNQPRVPLFPAQRAEAPRG